MTILRPRFSPTVIPQTAILQNRLANLAQQDPNQDPNQNQQDPNQEELQQEPMTGDYFKAQLEKYANRPAPPELNPSSRVHYADTSQTSPDNFTGYYDNLGIINAISENQLAAEQARAAYKKQQALQAIANMQAPAYGGAGSSSARGATGNIPSNPAANFKFAQNIAGNYGWDQKELAAWYTLGMKESGWRNTAQNPTSTAYGIGQFLDSTWKGYGIPKTSDPAQQVEAMARYIKARYGSPSRALSFHLSHNWY